MLLLPVKLVQLHVGKLVMVSVPTIAMKVQTIALLNLLLILEQETIIEQMILRMGILQVILVVEL